jgi:hypothetical protein
MSGRGSHAARLESSARLQALLGALREAGEAGLTTFQIFQSTGSMAVHSDCHELRANGYTVDCKAERTTESRRRVYRYRLTEGKAAAA